MLTEIVKEKIRNAVENKENFKIRGNYDVLTVVGEFLHSLGVRCSDDKAILPIDYGIKCIYVKHWNPLEYIATLGIDNSLWNDTYHNSAGVCNIDIPEIVIDSWVPKYGEQIEVSEFKQSWFKRKFLCMDGGLYLVKNDDNYYETWMCAREFRETEMTIKELEDLTGIKNLKIVKEKN